MPQSSLVMKPAPLRVQEAEGTYKSAGLLQQRGNGRSEKMAIVSGRPLG